MSRRVGTGHLLRLRKLRTGVAGTMVGVAGLLVPQASKVAAGGPERRGRRDLPAPSRVPPGKDAQDIGSDRSGYYRGSPYS
jgi:hypothetical protein